MTFGDNLRRLRRARGLTQQQLAEKTGYAQPTIAAYETGRLAPSLFTACNLADYFDVSLDELTGREKRG